MTRALVASTGMGLFGDRTRLQLILQRALMAFAPATVSNVSRGFDEVGFALEAPGEEVTAEGVTMATTATVKQHIGGRPQAYLPPIASRGSQVI